MTFRRLFLDHPQSIGESYAEHLAHALGFAGALPGLRPGLSRARPDPGPVRDHRKSVGDAAPGANDGASPERIGPRRSRDGALTRLRHLGSPSKPDGNC